MPKIELDVCLLVLTQDLTADAGDRLILFNDQVIGVVPKNTKLPQGLAIQQPARPTPIFSSDRVLALLGGPIKAWTVYDINKKLGWTGTKAAGECGAWLRDQVSKGNLVKTTGRYPAFGMVPTQE